MKIFGSIGILKDPKDFFKAVANGCTTVYLEEALEKTQRILKCTSLLGHEETFLLNEGKKIVTANIKTCFYNRCYEQERRNLVDLLQTYEPFETIAVLGSGVAVFSLHLNHLAKTIVNYDINRCALTYGMLNVKINGQHNVVNLNRSYENNLAAICISYATTQSIPIPGAWPAAR